MKKLLLKTLWLAFLSCSLAAEDAKFEMKGVKVSLISELSEVSPGRKFKVAFFIQHFDGFHTYWKNPGLVGFATTVNWELPEGFTAGEIQWQVPERSKMLKYNCHAYKGDAYLLVDMQAPEKIPEKFQLKAKVGGMSCSTKECCKIGFLDVAVDLKAADKPKLNKSSAEIISQAMARLPQLDNDIKVSSERKEDWLTLKISGELPKLSDVYFYSDENITDTESEQVLTKVDNVYFLKVKLNKYTPEKLSSLSGLLFSSSGWSEQKTKYIKIESQVN